ncbi:MAG: L,D-transpeptidase [Sphaerospermopsis sp. SIO1G2]|nr:L,D-transpeptidase [Sphaerospermopsis sp. SIO1G1]NET72076.1 L,D-transpeptidase [Sphaerospermopsis sp. SIO1G2]
MTMARNESIARMVMFLCFGAAILSLAVQWHTMKTTAQSNPNLSTNNRQNYQNHGDFGKNPGENVVAQKNVQNTNTQKQLHTANNKPRGFFFSDLAEAQSVPDSDQIKTQLLVDLSDRRVYVYHYDQVIASYPIAVGKKGWETPTGNFQIIHKEHHPIWKHPITGKVFEAGTDSPLGDRWIGFWSDGKNEIGFHGTPNTDLIGAAVSHGCLRMRNADVRMLYEQVNLNTPVLVRN